MLIVCGCGYQSDNLESFTEHRHDAHGDGTAYAICCNCKKRRRKAEMLHWPTGQYECLYCDGEVYLAKRHAIGQGTAAYARSCVPSRQPAPLPAPTGRFHEMWED
jgi:hypothetical protein